MPDQSASDDNLHELVADARRASADRLRGFRARALELFPPACVRSAGASSAAATFASSLSITGITITTTTPLMAATGNSCVCPVTSRSIHDVTPLTLERIHQATSGHRRLHTSHLPAWNSLLKKMPDKS